MEERREVIDAMLKKSEEKLKVQRFSFTILSMMIVLQELTMQFIMH